MKHLVFLGSLFFGFSLPGIAWSQEEYQIISLSPTLSVVQVGSRLTNLGISRGSEGVIVIDAYLASFAEEFTKVIEETSGKPADFVINTHFHGDHTGANSLLREKGALLIAHSQTREAMSQPSWSMIQERMMPAANPQALANLTVSDHSSLYLDQRVLWIDHVPSAHTAGDLIVYFPNENVLFTGDTLAIGTPTLSDHIAKGSLTGLIQAQERILSMVNEETKIIPGHGKIADKRQLEYSIRFLTAVKEKLDTYVQSNAPVESVLTSDLLSEVPDAGQSKDEARAKIFLKNAYESLIDKEENP